VEAGAREVGEEQLLEALDLAHAEIKRIIGAIDSLVRQVGRPKAIVRGRPMTPSEDCRRDWCTPPVRCL